MNFSSQENNTPQYPELKEGEDYSINPEGNLVFTARYLLKRGFCCGNGCKHCPFQQDSLNIETRGDIIGP